MLLYVATFILISSVFSCSPPLSYKPGIADRTQFATTVATGTIIEKKNGSSSYSSVGVIKIDCVYKSSTIDYSLIQGK